MPLVDVFVKYLRLKSYEAFQARNLQHAVDNYPWGENVFHETLPRPGAKFAYDCRIIYMDKDQEKAQELNIRS